MICLTDDVDRLISEIEESFDASKEKKKGNKRRKQKGENKKSDGKVTSKFIPYTHDFMAFMHVRSERGRKGIKQLKTEEAIEIGIINRRGFETPDLTKNRCKTYPKATFAVTKYCRDKLKLEPEDVIPLCPMGYGSKVDMNTFLEDAWKLSKAEDKHKYEGMTFNKLKIKSHDSPFWGDGGLPRKWTEESAARYDVKSYFPGSEGACYIRGVDTR